MAAIIDLTKMPIHEQIMHHMRSMAYHSQKIIDICNDMSAAHKKAYETLPPIIREFGAAVIATKAGYDIGYHQFEVISARKAIEKLERERDERSRQPI